MKTIAKSHNAPGERPFIIQSNVFKVGPKHFHRLSGVTHEDAIL